MPSQARQWTPQHAADWQRRSGWMIGCNYTPTYASNQIEVWAAETYNSDAIARELADAAGLGFNTLRVYLHDLFYAAGADAFLERIDDFLTIAAHHGLGVVPVIFDSVWNPSPGAGRQPEPRRGVHNAGWVQSPGIATLRSAARFSELEGYVRGLIGRFRNDPRILMWDLWNEPDNPNTAAYAAQDLGPAKGDVVFPLLARTFAWARLETPSQPLTSGVWIGDWQDAALTPLRRLQLVVSDVITFHCYDGVAGMAARIAELRRFNRPLICTEYMARPLGSTFEAILPLLARENVGAVSWGLHRGRTQTHLAWNTWQEPCEGEPETWFHDILWPDGRPYVVAETHLIRQIAAAYAQASRPA